ncbi:glycerophosphodiester phosphodiesterase [Virgibacillus sp. NKC19-3]|uniref:glycerophosphodiester phosphodiesterase n=1 Tax=Virgibacillus saliphilus TaxID=2831674 RepID=UPI001C9A85BC|nr:glycerophosphodiester phosphodiesterase family protein [Virgibacillus sp. NKC19-3]MBY7144647.1 glycerophosphodiester phosphodiesterase [Virgibacillus sp. NKC19-3]
MVLNFAHRGSLTEAPENTIPAFEKAIDRGAKGLELDVQLTKDDKLVVSHDHTFKRHNKDVEGRIRDFSLEEIRQIDVGSSFGKQFAGLTLPTLDEVLAIAPNDLHLNIEIKNIPVIYDGIEEILLACLSDNHRLDHVIISSFDHVALKKVQDQNADIPLGMLFYYRPLNAWDYVTRSGLNIRSIHPHHVYTDRNFVENCKALGYEVYPFTVNATERYAELLDYGVDGVFSNNPEIFDK